MPLITRCPACGTMFKVVADQLKVSQGWVRCGQCSDVFDASAHLMPRETPWQPAPPPAPSTVALAESPRTTPQNREPGAWPDSPVQGASPPPFSSPVLSSSNASPEVAPISSVSSVSAAVVQPARAPAPPLPPPAAPSPLVWAPAPSPASPRPPEFTVDDVDEFNPGAWRRSQQSRPSPEASLAGDDGLPPRPALMRTATADDSGMQPSAGKQKALLPSPSSTPSKPPGARHDSGFDASDFGQASRFSASGNSAFGHSRSGPAGVTDDAPGDDPDDGDLLDPASDVSFVREARRQAFWRRPVVRGLLVLFCLVLLAGLALQGAVYQRDNIAALKPEALPLLRALCRPLGCEIRSPRHIESLVVDGATFTRIGPEAYRLGFTLKNNGPTQVQTPSLELTLTDAQDRPVVRRVLAPAQFGAASSLLAAQSEMAGLVNVQVVSAGDAAGASASGSDAAPPLRVAGYRVLAFYPD